MDQLAECQRMIDAAQAVGFIEAIEGDRLIIGPKWGELPNSSRQGIMKTAGCVLSGGTGKAVTFYIEDAKTGERGKITLRGAGDPT